MRITSAGERIEITSQQPWITRVLQEAAAGAQSHDPDTDVDIRVRVEASREPFDTEGWEVLTRDSWRHQDQVVVRNACSSGLDVLVHPTAQHLEVTARWRPDLKVQGAGLLLRSRSHLLVRSVLVQFPALWWSQQRGRSPLHASTCTVGPDGPAVLIAGPGGVGKSTLIDGELARGARSTSDNLCVSDGFTVWGLLEPRRIPVTGHARRYTGRRMPHGRREAGWNNRVDDLTPDLVLVLRRNGSYESRATNCDPRDAARFLTAGTYMAGELRRYWSFAATLALGTGRGDTHPAVGRVAEAISSHLPCISLVLGRGTAPTLAEVVNRGLVEVR
jgi:hypothetical protein